jgi:hypothetical protein
MVLGMLMFQKLWSFLGLQWPWNRNSSSPLRETAEAEAEWNTILQEVVFLLRNHIDSLRAIVSGIVEALPEGDPLASQWQASGGIFAGVDDQDSWLQAIYMSSDTCGPLEQALTSMHNVIISEFHIQKNVKQDNMTYWIGKRQENVEWLIDSLQRLHDSRCRCAQVKIKGKDKAEKLFVALLTEFSRTVDTCGQISSEVGSRSRAVYAQPAPMWLWQLRQCWPQLSLHMRPALLWQDALISRKFFDTDTSQEEATKLTHNVLEKLEAIQKVASSRTEGSSLKDRKA